MLRAGSSQGGTDAFVCQRCSLGDFFTASCPRIGLPQRGVLLARLDQQRGIRIGVLPEREEFLVAFAGAGGIFGRSVRTGQTYVRRCPQSAFQPVIAAAAIEDLLKL